MHVKRVHAKGLYYVLQNKVSLTLVVAANRGKKLTWLLSLKAFMVTIYRT